MTEPANTPFTWLVFLTFNVPILGFLAVVPFGRRLNDALKEKDADSLGMTSYSRVTGALGAVILTAFFWGIGNVVLMDALGDRSHIQQLLDAVGRFFLVGSALFLPYAFNQLKSIFPWSASTAGAGLQGGTTAALGATGDPSIPVMGLTIANLSALGDAEVGKAAAAIGIQVTRDFAPEWRQSATLSVTHASVEGPKVAIDAASTAVIYLGDSSQDPDKGAAMVAAYHAQNHSQIAYSFVYLDVCTKYGQDWRVALSHEILELLADPTAVFTTDGPAPDGGGTVEYVLEVCDPTQGDTYPIDGTPVVNFVHRAFFGLPGGKPGMNHLGLDQTAFNPRQHGYITYTDDAGPQIVWGKGVTSGQQAARLILGEYRRNGRRQARRKPQRAAGRIPETQAS